MLLCRHSPGLLYIVSAPAGTGKTTLIQKLQKEFENISQSVSYTTRAPRDGEIDGVHYHFVSKERFLQMLGNNEFLESIELYGSFYGTSRVDVENVLKSGQNVVLVIDTQGKEKVVKSGFPLATTIFIKPPSLSVLRQRLELRNSEPIELIEKRLVWAEQEMKREKEYEFSLVNDRLDEAYEILRSIFIAVDHRRR